MSRKEVLRGSTVAVTPTLTGAWSKEKAAELEDSLHAVKALIEKPELTLSEIRWGDRLLAQLRQQLPDNADIYKLTGVLAHRVGDNAAAERHLRRACELNPEDAENDTNLAIALRAQGRLEDCQTALEAAHRKAPLSPIVHRNMGNLLCDQGAFQVASESFRRSLQLRSDHRETWENYAYALARARRLAEAIQAAHEAAGKGADLGDLLRKVGQWLLAHERAREAVAFFGEALQDDEDSLENLLGMAIGLMQVERPRDAHVFLDKVLDQDPDHVPALIHKAQDAVGRHHMAQAREYIERGLAKAPNVPALHVNLASVQFHEDDLEGAEKSCRTALRLAPNMPGAYGMLAQIARTNGDFETSKAYAEKVIELAPQKGGALSNLYASKKDVTEEDDVASVLARLEAQEQTSQRDLTAYNYTLGELFHKLKSPQRAIFFFKAANDFRRIGLKREGNIYKERNEESNIARMKRIFSAAFFENKRDVGSDSARPIFIVGMPRSGTTLTEQIISSHPLVFGAGELPAVPNEIRRVTRQAQAAGETVDFPGWVPMVEDEKFAEMAQGYLDYIAELNGDALRVTDKMPHNFLNVGLIAAMFPNAKIVHCMRDPVDNCLSCFQQNFAMPHTYSTNLKHLGHHYRQYREIMAHWRRVVPNAIYEVQYEELVADQERVSRELIAFCGLDWDDACLQFNKQQRAVKTASVWQVRQPIYSGSVQKWKMYDGYIDELVDELNQGLV